LEKRTQLECYSKTKLLEWFKVEMENNKSPRLPHNRRVITDDEFKARDFRGGLNKRKTTRNKKSRKSRKNKKSRRSRK
jgi:hypothetical protein